VKKVSVDNFLGSITWDLSTKFGYEVLRLPDDKCAESVQCKGDAGMNGRRKALDRERKRRLLIRESMKRKTTG
jgi:hypothetical protein